MSKLPESLEERLWSASRDNPSDAVRLALDEIDERDCEIDHLREENERLRAAALLGHADALKAHADAMAAALEPFAVQHDTKIAIGGSPTADLEDAACALDTYRKWQEEA